LPNRRGIRPVPVPNAAISGRLARPDPGGAVRGVHSRADPAMEAARDRIERRAEGRHLLSSPPALAREAGARRPGLPGANDYGLAGVNHVSAGCWPGCPASPSP